MLDTKELIETCTRIVTKAILNDKDQYNITLNCGHELFISRNCLSSERVCVHCVEEILENK